MREELVARTLVVCGLLCCIFSPTTQAQSLANPSFESPAAPEGGGTPEHWFAFSSTNAPRITVTMDVRRQGSQSCKFTAQQESEAYQGIAQRFTCVTGKTYTFTTYIRGDVRSSLIGGAYGQISLEWQDANGIEISRVHGPVWSGDLATDRWTKFSVTASAPEGAFFGVAVITFFSKSAIGFGSFFADDCELKIEL